MQDAPQPDRRMPDEALDRARRGIAGSSAVPGEVTAAEGDPDRVCDQYVLVRQVGRGGAADVWKAWDRELRRWAAVKILRNESPEVADRFMHEARLAAKWNHPNIVAVYGVGLRQGVPYIAMQYVEGAPLGSWRLPLRSALEAVRDAARAVQYAHQNGVLHRDLKPGNILLGPDGRVYVTDFGLARGVEAPGFTRPGTVLGTPHYMSPEQVRADPALITVRSDVYSLGATLYELCTGRPPYSGDTAAGILAKVVSEDPPPPRSLNPEMPREVEAIIMKAMAREPAARYDGAAAFATDIDRFLRGEPIQARPRPAWKRFARRVRSHPLALFLLLAVLSGSAGIVFLHARNTRLANEARELERRQAEEQERRRRAGDLLRPATQILDRWEESNGELGEEDRRTVVNAIQAAFSSFPDFAPAWHEEGRWRWLDGDLAGAEEAFGRTLSDAAVRYLGRYYRSRMRIARYLGMRPLPALNYSSRGVLLDKSRMQAEGAVEKRLREDAIADLEEFAREAPLGHGDVRVAYGEALLAICRAGSPEEYLRAAQKMNEAMDRSRVPLWEAYSHQAFAFFYGGDFESARAVYDRAIRAGRRDAKAFHGRGLAAHAVGVTLQARREDPTGVFREAIADFSRALELQDDPGVWNGRGNTLLSMAEFVLSQGKDCQSLLAQAIADFSRALEREPRLASWNNRGLARMQLAELRRSRSSDPSSDLLAAIDDFSGAIGMDGRLAALWVSRGSARIDLAEFEASQRRDPSSEVGLAMQDLSQALKLDENYVRGWCERGRAYLVLANRRFSSGMDASEAAQEVERAYSRALSLDPGNVAAYFGRGLAFRLLRKWRLAKADLEQAIALDPGRTAKCRPLLRECEDHLERGEE